MRMNRVNKLRDAEIARVIVEMPLETFERRRHLKCHRDPAVAIPDRHPVSPGHTPIIPRRRLAGWFELRQEEAQAAFDLLARVQEHLDREHRPEGCNIGAAAGQTMFPMHVHLIPPPTSALHPSRSTAWGRRSACDSRKRRLRP